MAADLQEIILPPEPPTQEEDTLFVPGKFDYATDYDKAMLKTAFQAINLLKLWDFIKEDPGEDGFMWSADNRINKIYYKIEELGYTGHSGCSFGITIRNMQFIAQYGEKEFRENYLLSKKKEP